MAINTCTQDLPSSPVAKYSEAWTRRIWTGRPVNADLKRIRRKLESESVARDENNDIGKIRNHHEVESVLSTAKSC